MPPEDRASHVSASLVNPALKEFDIEKLVEEEKKVLDELAMDNSDTELEPLEIESSGPVEAAMDEEASENVFIF